MTHIPPDARQRFERLCGLSQRVHAAAFAVQLTPAFEAAQSPGRYVLLDGALWEAAAAMAGIAIKNARHALTVAAAADNTLTPDQRLALIEYTAIAKGFLQAITSDKAMPSPCPTQGGAA